MNTDVSRLNCRARWCACVIALSTVGLWSIAVHAGDDDKPDPPATVYVFNGGPNNEGRGDAYNKYCQGWIFQLMGLLGPLGEYPTLGNKDDGQDEDGLYNPAGQLVGKVLRDSDGNIIGYENADGTMRAYNIDTSATMRDAWEEVADGGNLIVAKHGVRYIQSKPDPDDPENRLENVVGTGVILDNGRTYPGFRPDGTNRGGTGAPAPTPPYELPPRPDADIDVYLNTCYSAQDADPDDRSKQPATDSIDEVDGVGEVDGHVDETIKTYTLTWSGPGSDKVDSILKACARRAGHTHEVVGDDGRLVVEGDIHAWLATLPISQERNRIIQCLKNSDQLTNEMVDALQLRIEYDKNPDDSGDNDCNKPDGKCKGYHKCPKTFDESGGSVHYQASPFRPSATLDIPEGALPQWTTVFVSPIDHVSRGIELPEHLEPVTFFLEVKEYEQTMLNFEIPAELTMSIYALDVDSVMMYWASPDGFLKPYPAFFDFEQHAFVMQIMGNGIWVGLREVKQPQPCLGDLNGDAVVNVSDLLILLSQWGPCDGCSADLNGDGVVNVSDLLMLLGAWGPCPG